MSRRRENEDANPKERISSDRDASSEAQLDEALEDSFPASDPVSVEHSDHAGAPRITLAPQRTGRQPVASPIEAPALIRPTPWHSPAPSLTAGMAATA